MNIVEQLPTLNNLLKHLQRVPYLASKNVYRVATHFLHMNRGQLEQFCAHLLATHEQLTKCPTCCWWQEKNGTCLFCSSNKRDKKIICIVESWHDVLAIERAGAFQGVYHVLGGLLNPLEGIGPQQLSINALITRIELGVQEIIFAFNQTPEGDATAAYIATKLANSHVKCSCLAQGIPVGASLEFTDRLTIYKALAQRNEF